MFKVKLYKYDSAQENNGYRGTGENDFSPFVLQASQLTEDITQELDTAEITLSGVSFSKEIEPATKLIMDIVEIGELGLETIRDTRHFVVSSDNVSQPILSDDTYFDHHLSLIEPSVIAQKRLVDNISVTYKLKDVSVEESVAYPTTDTYINIENSYFTPGQNFGRTTTEVQEPGRLEKIYAYYDYTGKYFELEGDLQIQNLNGETFSSIYNNIESFNTGSGYSANFILPKLAIMYGVQNTKTFSKIGYASISYSIQEYDIGDQSNPTTIASGNIISNSNLGEIPFNNDIMASSLGGQNLLEKIEILDGNIIEFTRKYTDTSAPTPNYIVSNVPIKTDKRYVVNISLYDFPGVNKIVSSSVSLTTIEATFPETSIPSISIYSDTTASTLPYTKTSGSGFFITYGAETKKIVYSSAIPYTAYSLLQKAIINSSLYEKTDGVYIADINNSNTQYYIDDDYIDELANTQVIENFYNQKNLWEIMIEVGHYIHAIPELKFGADDKFLITFNRLGKTEQKVDNSVPVSIFNSRSIEDYISSTSSYITNMVQLGGIIQEWVYPKTTNEQLLVSNDTAEILTTKPIIEIIEVIVKNNSTGQTADLTPYIYEENVYKTLSINYAINPNRGIALYYSLGTNKITGGQYQLPQANPNIYSDYTFKKVIWCAFNGGYVPLAVKPDTGYWTDLQVNDYSFFITYRTKDSVRQNHTRPDLRKYLLNSKYDRCPEYNQFNNQTDVLVDSIKFGSNIYGTLIKTGNSAYTKWEWNYDYKTLKKKGDLYNINGELYYVAKVTNYYYSSHILSNVKYSKDYNELSQVIGIPSEPRFYEISEQSLILREFAINDFLLLTDDATQLQYGGNFILNNDHLSLLVLGEGTDFAKYAVTVFKGDKDVKQYNQTIGEPNFYKDVFHPLNAHSSGSTLTYSWDMIDNYSAGDQVIVTEQPTKVQNSYYNSLLAVPYTDIYGKSPLLDFFIIGNVETLSNEQIMAQPESPITTTDNTSDNFIGNYDILVSNVPQFDTNFNGRGLGLLKDCREAISINYNLQLITNSDTFVVSPFVFLPNKNNVKLVLLNKEVNKLSNGYINEADIIYPLDTTGSELQPYFDFDITTSTQQSQWNTQEQVTTSFGVNLENVFSNVNPKHFTGEDGYERVKSIAFVCNVSLSPNASSSETTVVLNTTQFLIARNIPSEWTMERVLSPIYFGAPNKNNIFTKKQ